jgi:hypothetical protein
MTSINRCVPRKRKKNDDDDTFANEKYPNTEIRLIKKNTMMIVST